MASGREQIDRLEYREKIKNMGDRELLEHVAMEHYELCQDVSMLKRANSKAAGVGGGIGAVVVGIVVGVIEYFRSKPS